MNNTYYVPLNLDIYPLTRPIENCPKFLHAHISLSEVNPDFISLLNDLGLYIKATHLFYKDIDPIPNRLPHVDYIDGMDYKTGCDHARLNFVYKGKDSKMLWYKIKDNVQPKDVKQGGLINYVQYRFKELELAAATTIINKPCIVQVGQPHRIINSVEERYCLSFKLKRMDSNSTLTMNEMIENFKDYISIT
jgi:hypothetical protein